jgi:hypothetical protein
MNDILTAINNERAFQDLKYGDSKHDLMLWVRIMAKELAEAEHAIIKEPREAALREILQVVAVGVAALQQHGIVERATVTGRFRVYDLAAPTGRDFFVGYNNAKAQWGSEADAPAMEFAAAARVLGEERQLHSHVQMTRVCS